MRLHPRRLVLGTLGICLLVMILVSLVSDQGGLSSRDLAKRQLNEKLKNWVEAEPKDDNRKIDDGKQLVLQSIVPLPESIVNISEVIRKAPPSHDATVPTTNISSNSSSKVFIPYVPSKVGHDNQVKRVWPDPEETEDRILSQMALKSETPVTKKILVFRGVSAKESGSKKLIAHKCPVTNCDLTGDSSQASSADAILFEGSISEPVFGLGKKRPPNQLWVLFFLESPHHTMGLKEFYGKVNFTATYRRDSTMVTPYERWTQFPNITSLPQKASRNFAEGKTKKVAWFVSNCGARNGRLEYAKELAKYIEVDIYGHCGTKKCPRVDSKCFGMLKTDYKFYLSFENSNCKDYITEKLYWNAYQNDVLPIVMGASPSDYNKVAPPGSFIHVDNFAGPKALADYLSLLDSDDDLYNQYFRWKGTGEFIDTKWWCRLCAMVHEAGKSEHKSTFTDLDNWWRGPGTCITPSGDMKWSTWRNPKL